MSVRISFLGGLGEIGRNCAAIEHDGKIALIDCGLMFPEEHMLGVDLVFPDWGWLVERKKDVVCVVITHGHEDHIGALGQFLGEVNVPVYGTEFSMALVAKRVEEYGVDADLRPVADNEWVEEDPFRFVLIPVSHSVPQGAGIAFDTPEGLIVHSGDFKLDPTPIDGRPTDLPGFAALGRDGVRLLLADSTNAEEPGFVPSETSLATPIREIVQHAPGRVIPACFASHVHRVQQIADAAVASGRSIAFLGRSMQRVSGVAIELGILQIPEDRIMDIVDLIDLPPHKQMVISTGSQGEPFAALSLIASGRHKFVELDPTDTVLVSATPIPGNEAAVSRVISRLWRSGATVYHGRNSHVHVSGHGAQDELKTFLNVVRPRSFVPVHGEYRHLRAHSDLARQMRVPDVFTLEDGDAIVIDGDETRVEWGAVSGDFVYFDGSEFGDVGASVIRDRRHLGDDGVVIAIVGVRHGTAEVTYGPELHSHGLMDDPTTVLAEVKDAIVAELASRNGSCEAAVIKKATRDTVRRIVREKTARKPVVVSVVLET
ncbi:ribonuclease J 1 [bacterium BMS3Bbin01]|nr:ribonuclease J 1 [bacterium BMS3Bbin01]